MAILNERMRNSRKAKGYTQEEVARHIGVSKQTIQRYESGEITNIPADKIKAIAQFLLTTPAYLVGWDESPRKEMSPDLKEILEKGEVWFNGVEYSLSKENGKMLARMIKAALEEDK